MGLSISGSHGRFDAYQLLGERMAQRLGRHAEGQPSGKSAEFQDEKASIKGTDPSKAEGPGGKPLSEADQKMVEDLKQRDRAVRAHEQAHMAAGGSLVRGGATYSFQLGPDGQRYAVGGEVSIDTSAGRNPQETVAKAQAIKSAALAPADPSAADRAVAAKATKMEAEARKDLESTAYDGQNVGQSSGKVTKPQDGEASTTNGLAEGGEGRVQSKADRELVPDNRVVLGIAAYRAANDPMSHRHSASSGLELLA